MTMQRHNYPVRRPILSKLLLLAVLTLGGLCLSGPALGQTEIRTPVDRGAPRFPQGVWGSGDSDILAVGQAGAIPPDGPPRTTETPTPTPSDTPTITHTPSIVPSRTNTAGYYIYGEARDADSDAGLEGAVVTLYRDESGNWVQLNQWITDSNGHYHFGFVPSTWLHRLVETDPSGYVSDRVMLPPGFGGTMVDANTIEFEPHWSHAVGPLVFYDRLWLTPTPKQAITPSPTADATATIGRYPLCLPLLLRNPVR